MEKKEGQVMSETSGGWTRVSYQRIDRRDGHPKGVRPGEVWWCSNWKVGSRLTQPETRLGSHPAVTVVDVLVWADIGPRLDLYCVERSECDPVEKTGGRSSRFDSKNATGTCGTRDTVRWKQ